MSTQALEIIDAKMKRIGKLLDSKLYSDALKERMIDQIYILREARDEIANLPIVSSDGWIDVNESLPDTEKQIECIVYTLGRVRNAFYFPEIKGFNLLRVTHWKTFTPPIGVSDASNQ